MRSLERLVSGERRRFVNSKYDLDLTCNSNFVISYYIEISLKTALLLCATMEFLIDKFLLQS